MHDTPWWRDAVVYQVYPRSFADSDGDGVGDLEGIRRRLDHLVDLGVDAVWISPIYPSPMADFGYDVTDHTGVDPMFGTLDDAQRLLDDAHARGLKVLLDLVPGHTSDQHPWFVAARSSRDHPWRGRYVWRDPAPDGGPPTNWLSEFGGPAWTFDEATRQHYLHLYLASQPTLNWRDPAVVDGFLDVMRTWLDRGVDGFRVDAVQGLVVDAAFRDDPLDPTWREGDDPARRLRRDHTAHLPEVVDIARRMRALVERYDGDRVLIGEAYGTLEQVVAYYGGAAGDGFHLPFNFALIGHPWDAPALAATIEAYEAALPPGGWPSWVLGNHDRSRIASRVGPAQARVAATLLLTLRGTPTLYQGDELGMVDTPVPADAVRDPWELQVPGQGLGRDPVRTPLPWDDHGPGRGFTSGSPWLPMDDAVAAVATQAGDPTSMLAWYRTLLALRREQPALRRGSYRTRHVDDHTLVFERGHDGARLAVACNLTAAPRHLDPLPGRVLASTHAGDAPTDRLRPHEARVVALG